MNAPILADQQGTPARPTRGLLDTTLDSQNKDRALAIVARPCRPSCLPAGFRQNHETSREPACIYAYDAYILETARSSGFPLLALDGPIRRNAKKLGLSLVELDL
jgi:hypothetical protein